MLLLTSIETIFSATINIVAHWPAVQGVGPQGQKWSNRHSTADTTRFIPKDAREIVFVFVFGAPS